jgi:hypothetical protein
MNVKDHYLLLFSASFIILTITIAYSIVSNSGTPPEISVSDEVSGIVIHRDGGKIWLRLTMPDEINNLTVGEIETYAIQDREAEDFDIGDLVKGRIMYNKTIEHEPGIPFFEYDRQHGFVNRGYLLLFKGGGISQSLSDPYPVLQFNLRNLGENEVTAVRAKINDFQLPFTFDISTDSPLEPSNYKFLSRYVSWYDPSTGDTSGYKPEDGEEYTVEITVKFEDSPPQVFTREGVFQLEGGGSIATIAGFERLYFREPDLISKGPRSGGTVSTSFRNNWWSGSPQDIDRLQIYVDDSVIMDENINIEFTDYFALSVHIPFDIIPLKHYDVTLVAHSTTGLNSTYTIPTLCQFHSIH